MEDCALINGSGSNVPWGGVEDERDDPSLGVGDVQREEELLQGVAEG